MRLKINILCISVLALTGLCAEIFLQKVTDCAQAPQDHAKQLLSRSYECFLPLSP